MIWLLEIGLIGLLQSTGLLILGLLALRLLRRRGPTAQTLAGRATLAAVSLTVLLAAPLAGHVHPVWRVTLPASPASLSASPPATPRKLEMPAPETDFLPAIRPLPAAVSPDMAPSAVPTAPEPPAPPPVPAAARLPQIYAALLALWTAGTAALLFWLCVCQGHLTVLRRAARPVTSGPLADALAALDARPPLLLTHPAIRSPFLAGIFRPAIFLPERAEEEFRPDALRAILAHEMAHLARRDCAWTLACRVLCALLWPQPLLWLLCRRLEQIGEEACDQAVLAQNCPPRAYADCLLTLAERHSLSPRERALAAGVAPYRSSLGRRIQHILDKGTHAMSTVSPQLRLTIAAGAIAAVITGAFLVSCAPAKQASAASHPPADPLSQAKLLAGMTPVQGPGVIVTLRDSKKPLPSRLPPGMISPNLIHDTDINQVVNELKAAGAEAIAVNDQRLVATTPIRCAGPTIFVNFTPQTPPYTIKAIGSPKTLAAILNRPWGIASQIKRFDASMVSVDETRSLRLPAYTELIVPHYAKPASFIEAPSTNLPAGAFLVSSAPAQSPAPLTVTRTPEQQRIDAKRLQDFNNLKQIGMALGEYVEAHPEHYPDAAHWMDALSPYLKDKSVFFDPLQPGRYRYAYNRNCSGKSITVFANRAETPIVFESALGIRNANDTGQSLRSVSYIPGATGRGSAALFADGHVQWIGANAHSMFAVHIAPPPPNYLAAVPLQKLIKERDLEKSTLHFYQKSVAHANQKFEQELYVLLPQADAQKMAAASALELQLGEPAMGLESMKKRQIRKISNKPRDSQPNLNPWKALLETQLRPLLAQEAKIFPTASKSRLANLHALAAQRTSWDRMVSLVQVDIDHCNNVIQQRQQNREHSEKRPPAPIPGSRKDIPGSDSSLVPQN